MTYEEKIGKQKFAALVADFFANRYIDRGMRKWQGYYLSDHTAALKKGADRASDLSAAFVTRSGLHSDDLASSIR